MATGAARKRWIARISGGASILILILATGFNQPAVAAPTDQPLAAVTPGSGDIRELKARLARAGFNPGSPDTPLDNRAAGALYGYLLQQKLVKGPDEGGEPPPLKTAIPLALAHMRVQQGPVPLPDAPVTPPAGSLAVVRERAFVAASSGVRDLGFDATSRRIATVGDDGQVSLWDAATGSELARLRPGALGQPPAPRRVRFSPDGLRLASLDGDDAVQIWDVASQRLLTEFRERGSRPMSLAFSPDGQLLAVTWSDTRLRRYDVSLGSSGRLLGVLEWATTPPVFSPDGLAVVVGNRHQTSGWEGAIKAWTVKGDPAPAWMMRNPPADDSFDLVGPVFLSFLATGRLLAATDSGALWVLDWPAGTQGAYLRASNPDPLGKVSSLQPTGLVTSADSQHVAMLYLDGRIGIWSVDARDPSISTASEFQSRLRDYQIAWRQGEGGGHLSKAFHPVYPLPRHAASVNAAVFTQDNRFLLSVSNDGTAKAWDSPTGQLVASFDGRVKPLLAIAVSPDGQHAATGGADGEVRLWRLQ